MLTTTMMMSSLLLLSLFPPKKYWTVAFPSLILLFMISMKPIYIPMTNLNSMYLFMSDTLSTPLASLSIWISALMILASTKMLMSNNSPKSLTTWILILLLLLLIAFYSNSMMMFYISFEASLIPILFMILGWGYQPERLQAGMYLMMYTILASLPLLLSLLMWMNKTGHLSMLYKWDPPQTPLNMMLLWWFMSTTAFLVKLPLFLSHLWLPKAHVEAPVAGSMILAAILLKLGGFGLMRMTQLMPTPSTPGPSLITSISMWGAAITSMICLRQPDLKALIAYSSVGHMGLLIAGTMSETKIGLSGTMTMMIAHGLSSSALFAISNMTYEMSNTRNLYLSKGMSSTMPYMALWWFLLSAANMAAPPSFNLLSEILLITSIVASSSILWIPLALSSFLSAAYSLYMYTATQHGSYPQFTNPTYPSTSKNSSTIMLHLAPLILLMLKPELICH